MLYKITKHVIEHNINITCYIRQHNITCYITYYKQHVDMLYNINITYHVI